MNLTRKGTASLKKTTSYFYQEYVVADFGADLVHQLAQMPKEIIVNRAAIRVYAAAPTDVTAALAIGSTAVLAAADIDTINTTVGSTWQFTRILTGGPLTLTLSATATGARIGVYLEYLEYTKASGELTSLIG
jgi:hypothetical protein